MDSTFPSGASLCLFPFSLSSPPTTLSFVTSVVSFGESPLFSFAQRDHNRAEPAPILLRAHKTLSAVRCSSNKGHCAVTMIPARKKTSEMARGYGREEVKARSAWRKLGADWGAKRVGNCQTHHGFRPCVERSALGGGMGVRDRELTQNLAAVIPPRRNNVGTPALQRQPDSSAATMALS